MSYKCFYSATGKTRFVPGKKHDRWFNHQADMKLYLDTKYTWMNQRGVIIK